MGKYATIQSDAFEKLQIDAGVLLKSFDPSAPSRPKDSDIITATTGGIEATCEPTYSDFADDVDNVPENTKEYKHLDGWDCSISTTALGVSADVIKLSLGAADASTSGVTKITPRHDLKQSDFTDSIWWVGDLANGGAAAVELKNVLSTGGFSLQTTKNGKGELTLELTGHVSVKDISVVPMNFYIIDPDEEEG